MSPRSPCYPAMTKWWYHPSQKGSSRTHQPQLPHSRKAGSMPPELALLMWARCLLGPHSLFELRQSPCVNCLSRRTRENVTRPAQQVVAGHEKSPPGHIHAQQTAGLPFGRPCFALPLLLWLRGTTPKRTMSLLARRMSRSASTATLSLDQFIGESRGRVLARGMCCGNTHPPRAWRAADGAFRLLFPLIEPQSVTNTRRPHPPACCYRRRCRTHPRCRDGGKEQLRECSD